MDAPTSVNIPESEIIALLGISGRVLDQLRLELTVGDDFLRSSRKNYYTPAGVEKLHRLIHASLGAESPPPPVLDAALAIHAFTFARYTQNKNIVLATDGQNTYRVRIRASENWVKGMPVHCTHTAADLYEHHGPLPRSRGRL